MKKIVAIVITVLSGLFILAGYFFQSQLAPLLSLVVDWAIVLMGVAMLIGVGYLIRMHIGKLVHHEKGNFYSVVFLIVFFFTLVAGFVLSFESPVFQNGVLNILIPIETSLLAILAVILLYASLHLIRTQGWTGLSVGFLASAIVSFVLKLGIMPSASGGWLDILENFLRRLPWVGARGILLGIALGSLIIGLRVLLTIDRPYGEE